MDIFRLEGKRAVVTGGASGIGMATAGLLADAGAEVMVLDRKFDPEPAADDRLRNARRIELDVTDEAGVAAAFGDLAKATGGIARAVGTACGANPIPIFIPCHRVLAADRQLGGFSGGKGPETKAFLLTLEGAWPVQHDLPL